MPTSSPKKNWNWRRLKRLPISLTVKCFGLRWRRPLDQQLRVRSIHFLHILSVAFFPAGVFLRRLRWNSIRVPAWGAIESSKCKRRAFPSEEVLP